MSTPSISFIIPTYKQTALLQQCVRSVLMQTVSNIEVIVIDNGSELNVSEVLGGFEEERLRIIRLRRNVFFCAAVNEGIRVASSAYVCTLNDDAWIESDWAEQAISSLESDPTIGSIASLVLKVQDPTLIDSAGNHLDIACRATNIHHNEPISHVCTTEQPVFGPSSACALYRMEAIKHVGFLDELFVAYYEDVDLAFRLQLAGFKSVFVPKCRAYHVRAATQKADTRVAFLLERNRMLTILKDLPLPIFVNNFHKIMLATVTPFPPSVGIGRRTQLRALAASVFLAPVMLRRRARIQRNSLVSSTYIEALLRSREVRASIL
jgi:GT2 family glycosyltransferase